MKRLIISAVLSAAAVNFSWGTIGTYTNNSVVTNVPLTNIDATNFVNLNTFSFSTPSVYSGFSNVRSYTNHHVMRNSGSGFQFDTALTTAGRVTAANFYNAALAGNPSTNATVYAEYQLLVLASNIVSRGLLGASSFGLIKLDGRDVDVSRGAFQIGTFSDRAPLFPEAVFDQAWGLGASSFTPDNQIISTYPSTPNYQEIQFTPANISFPYSPGIGSLYLADPNGNALKSAQYVTEIGTNRTVQIVFVRNFNTNITTEIRLAPNPAPNARQASPGIPVIEWKTAGTNAFGQIVTNTVYLKDTLATTTNLGLIQNFPFSSQPPQSVPIPPASYQPANFTVTRSTPFEFFSGTPGNVFVDPPPGFWTTNNQPERITATYSSYMFRLATTTTDPSQMTQQAITNVRTGPGRIEMKATRSLNLDLARVDGLNYLSLNSTNHFAGASNATIVATYADVNLGSTNGNLNATGVLRSYLPHINGTVSCYSAKWNNVVFFDNGRTNVCDFHVLLVDSDLQEYASPQVLSLGLRSTNVVVGDTFDIIEKLSLDASRLTISSNGVIRVFQPDIAWSDSVPRVIAFTNHGLVDFSRVNQEMDFVSHDAVGGIRPYGDFVNFGVINSPATMIQATNVLNGGVLNSLSGSLSVTAVSNIALLSGGSWAAPSSDLRIDCRNLVVTNHLLAAGRALWLTITGSLQSGTNNWTVQNGFHLLNKPTTGDLTNTTITDTGYPYSEVLHTWAGQDRGAAESGFTNNAALGQLVLDGGVSTLFTFSGTGPSGNALYVDRLELTNYAGQFDPQGNLAALQINPGMKIYYADATINGASIAEFLNGKNGGQLQWVTNRAGPFSGTNVVYPDGTTNFLNRALVSSCNLDSNTNGIPNCVDPAPVFLQQMAKVSASKVSASVVYQPDAKLALSWETGGGVTSQIYEAMSNTSSSWKWVANVVAPAGAGVVTNKYLAPMSNGSRFYRVVVQPAP